MKYDVSVSKDSKYIICKVDGDFDAEGAADFNLAMDKLKKSTKIKKMFLDLSKSKNISSTLENYNFSHHTTKELEFGHDVTIAILVSHNDHSHDFVETTARNAGYNVKLFRDKNDAVSWLTDG